MLVDTKLNTSQQCAIVTKQTASAAALPAACAGSPSSPLSLGRAQLEWWAQLWALRTRDGDTWVSQEGPQEHLDVGAQAAS